MLSLQQVCIRSQLHLAHPCKRRTPALKGFVTAAVLRLLGHGNGLHSHAAASPLIPASAALRLEGLHLRILAFAVSITATACSRSRLLSWLGNSLHPQSVACMAAACIRTQLHPAHPCKRCTPALKGFVCAALLRCSWHGNSLHSQSAAPAQHDSAALRLEGLRLRNHAFAVTATARIRSRLHLVQQACIRTQLHLALAAVRCPQVVQPPSATCR